MKIKSIQLENFQSHEDSILEFHSGVNIIVGKSDSGKTSIFRAIRWLKDNRPLGSSIVRNGTNKVQVELEIDTPHGIVNITHSRKGEKSTYRIGDIYYEAMGSSVPEEVESLLDLGQENIQFQFDSPFLVLGTPGKIADIINEVTYLEDAGLVNKELERKRQESKRESARLGEELKNIQSELEKDKFKNLPEMRKLVNKRKELLKKEGELLEKNARLSSIIPSIENGEENISEIDSRIKKLEPKLDKFHILEKELSEKYKKLDDKKDELEELELIIDLVEKGIKEEETLRLEYDAKKVTYRKLLNELKVCPTCGIEIQNDTQKKKIIKNA